MQLSISELQKILVQQNYVSEDDSKVAASAVSDSDSYVQELINHGLLTKMLLGQAMAEYYSAPYADFSVTPPDKPTVLKLPEKVARNNRAIAIKESDQDVVVASDVPPKVNLKEIASYFVKKNVRVSYALPETIDDGFSLYERPLETRFSEIIQSGARVAPEIVDEIIRDAVGFRASDIHFEPRENDVLVRFRVDGNLREAGRVPPQYYENILNRIKVESGMRIDEHLNSQDGALQRKFENVRADLRVSLVPTVRGEKVVMRVLGSYVQSYTLSDIGLDATHQRMLEDYASRPFGMILTVGPTGSGKTTTLYSIVKMLNKPNVNITSIEDPVEYKISGVNQIQVREQANMTFARGLRSVVRQDPNIILVGEIRDQETAEISVNAALTGHLLLSTFHANDAATAIPRLIDMGIEPFLLASTLEVIIAQRLVRKICMNCRYSLPVKDALQSINPERAVLVAKHFSKSDTVYAGKGCNICSNSGYKGRVPLFEFVGVTSKIQDLITKNPSSKDIEAEARKQGEKSMFDDGMAKVKSGLTTIAEVVRVVEPPRLKGR